MNYTIINKSDLNKILKDSKNLKEITIKILQENLEGNMQEDKSCFEAWVFILKCKYPDLKINLEFGNYKFNKTSMGHVNRFKYRLMKFIELYPNLLNNTDDIEEFIRDFKDDFYKSSFEINIPTDEPKEPVKASENYIEYQIARNWNEVFNKYNFDTFNRQLPVGLFKNIKSKENSIFTYGHSDIDLWAIKETDFYIFELKKDNNKKLGIITELLFYANFMHEVFYNDKVKMPDNKSFRSIEAIRNLKNKKHNVLIKPYFLVGKFHKEIEDDYENLLKLINNNDLYEFKTIKYIFKDDKIELKE